MSPPDPTMTTRGKIVLTILILGAVGFGVRHWWDEIAPWEPADTMGRTPSGNAPTPPADDAAVAPIQGIGDYARPMKDGKPVIRFPVNPWPGCAPIIMANQGLAASEASLFARRYGFYVEILLVDDPVKARELFASGHSPVLWGTLDTIALFAPELARDSRTLPVVCQQIDWSDGGDGLVARGDIRSMNDFRQQEGHRRKVALVRNSRSHYLILSLLSEAGIHPAEVDFRWAADAAAAAQLFVRDASFDAFVGLTPDIHTASESVPNTRLIVSTDSANHLLAGVWAVRNDFFQDHPEIVANLVRGIFEGMDLVRQDPQEAARRLAAAFQLPVEECAAMIGADGGIAEGDAHLTHYRENERFFLDPMHPSNFEVVWHRTSSLYPHLGVLTSPLPSTRVKAAALLAELAREYRNAPDLSQPFYRPGTMSLSAEAAEDELLTQAFHVHFEPNRAVLNPDYDPEIPKVLERIGELAVSFGKAHIVIEGHTDASRHGGVPTGDVRRLSYDRAEAVRRALMAAHNLDPNQFRVRGKGWDHPMAGATDPGNGAHNRRNRRVDVRVFPLEME